LTFTFSTRVADPRQIETGIFQLSKSASLRDQQVSESAVCYFLEWLVFRLEAMDEFCLTASPARKRRAPDRRRFF